MANYQITSTAFTFIVYLLKQLSFFIAHPVLCDNFNIDPMHGSCLYVASAPNLPKMFQDSSRPQKIQIRKKYNTL